MTKNGQIKARDKSKMTLYPAVIIVALITQVPFAVSAILSFFSWNVKRPDQGIHFIGLANYKQILADSNFWIVVKNTLLILVVCMVLCTVLAILFSVLFNRKFKGGYFFRTLLVMPYFVMDCVVGIVWKTLLLNPNLGLNYYVSHFLGIQPIDFFGQHALLTIIMLIIWQWTPFFFLIIIAGFQNIPEDVLESARIDGANGFTRLIRIEIPMIRKHINSAMTIGLINILKIFGLVYVTTQGGPGVSSSNLPYLTYRTIFYDWKVGKASAIAVVTVVITLFLAHNFFKYINKNTEEDSL